MITLPPWLGFLIILLAMLFGRLIAAEIRGWLKTRKQRKAEMAGVMAGELCPAWLPRKYYAHMPACPQKRCLKQLEHREDLPLPICPDHGTQPIWREKRETLP